MSSAEQLIWFLVVFFGALDVVLAAYRAGVAVRRWRRFHP